MNEERKDLELLRQRFLRQTEKGLEELARRPDLRKEWERLWAALFWRPARKLTPPDSYGLRSTPRRPAA